MNETLKQRSAGRLFILGLITLLGLVGLGWSSQVSADVESDRATNVHEGDNENDTNQDGEAGSGDAVTGQVAGVVSSGDASVDATNLSEDVEAESGDAEGTNRINSIAANVVVDEGCPPPSGPPVPAPPEEVNGLVPFAADCPEGSSAADIDSLEAVIVHEGDNEIDANQSLALSTGDVVGGQVIGVVASGSADVVAANTSRDVELESGDAEGLNDINALAVNFVSLGGPCCPIPGLPGVADIDSATATVVHEGDNEISVDQSLDLSTGDVVGGQVIGVVSSGDASVDATNLSEDVEGESGDAEGVNNFNGAAANAVAGAAFGFIPADIESLNAVIVHEGDNDVDSEQSWDAASGDVVGGQIIGVVASGVVDVVSANTSLDVELETGESDGTNDFDGISGLLATEGLVLGPLGEGLIEVI